MFNQKRNPIAGVSRKLWTAGILALVVLAPALPGSSRGVAAPPTVTSICIQDDSSSNSLVFNPANGMYTFQNCTGFAASGTGTVKIVGSVITLTDIRNDRRLTASVDRAQKHAQASYQRIRPSTLFTIADRNTANDTCPCSAG